MTKTYDIFTKPNLVADCQEFSPRDATKFLEYVANLWMSATNGTAWDEPVMNDNNTQIIDYILTLHQESHAAKAAVHEMNNVENCALEPLYEVWKNYAQALRSVDPNNPVQVTATLEDNMLFLGWDGSWTPGRFFGLTIFCDGSGLAEWDTGTGKESKFMGLDRLF